MLCGAQAVQIGTANLLNPQAYSKIFAGFVDYLNAKKITSLNQLIGKLNISK